MRIYILPVAEELQPVTQGFIWPPGCDDYGIEQDMLVWLQESDLLTDNPDEADWHYLPVFWNRWFWQNQEDTSGKGAFNDAIQAAILDRERTFTVDEADPSCVQPDVDLSGVTVCTGNRVYDNGMIDVPLLLNPHPMNIEPQKKYLASFIGQLATHPSRSVMMDEVGWREDSYITGEFHGIEEFTEVIQSSYVALAPCGDGAQSYRMYEAMQLGVVPLYISDIDARPFRRWLDWDAFSLYLPSAEGLAEYLDSLDRDDLAYMGVAAQWAYYEHLRYGEWCKYVVKELENR